MTQRRKVNRIPLPNNIESNKCVCVCSSCAGCSSLKAKSLIDNDLGFPCAPTVLQKYVDHWSTIQRKKYPGGMCVQATIMPALDKASIPASKPSRKRLPVKSLRRSCDAATGIFIKSKSKVQPICQDKLILKKRIPGIGSPGQPANSIVSWPDMCFQAVCDSGTVEAKLDNSLNLGQFGSGLVSDGSVVCLGVPEEWCSELVKVWLSSQ